MSAPGIPINFYVSQGNLQVYLQWDIVAGATSYLIQRSLDGVNFSPLDTVNINNYVDTNTEQNVQFWYQVASQNVPTLQATAEMDLTAGQPNSGDTFTLANYTFTAVSSSPAAQEFLIGADTTTTAQNIVSVISSTLQNIILASSNGPLITLLAFSPGAEGNGLQFSSGLTNATIVPFSGGVDGGVSGFTAAQSVIPTVSGELSLLELRLRAQQRADRVNSNFVTLTEWNSYLNTSLFELYDLLVTNYEDYFLATPASFTTNGSTNTFPLPDGVASFKNGFTGDNFVAPAFYKLMGVDLAVQTANNAWVTINKFTFQERNQFLFPNTASTIYGVYNLRYRLMGNAIQFIPTPSGNQLIRIWYIPRMTELLQDTDTTQFGISGWWEYVAVRAAILALNKEESDVSLLVTQLGDLRKRIIESGMNRDAGQPDRITDVRASGALSGYGFGGFGPGPMAGW